MTLILVVLLILMLLGVLPVYPYSRGFGWSPFVLILILFVILLVLNGGVARLY